MHMAVCCLSAHCCLSTSACALWVIPCGLAAVVAFQQLFAACACYACFDAAFQDLVAFEILIATFLMLTYCPWHMLACNTRPPPLFNNLLDVLYCMLAIQMYSWKSGTNPQQAKQNSVVQSNDNACCVAVVRVACNAMSCNRVDIA